MFKLLNTFEMLLNTNMGHAFLMSLWNHEVKPAQQWVGRKKEPDTSQWKKKIAFISAGRTHAGKEWTCVLWAVRMTRARLLFCDRSYSGIARQIDLPAVVGPAVYDRSNGGRRRGRCSRTPHCHYVPAPSRGACASRREAAAKGSTPMGCAMSASCRDCITTTGTSETNMRQCLARRATNLISTFFYLDLDITELNWNGR